MPVSSEKTLENYNTIALIEYATKANHRYRLNSIPNIFLLYIHIFLYVFPNANIVYMINFVIVALPVVL